MPKDTCHAVTLWLAANWGCRYTSSHLGRQRYRGVICDDYSWIAPCDDRETLKVFLRRYIVELLGIAFYGLRELSVLSLGHLFASQRQPTPSPVPRVGAHCIHRRSVKRHG